MRLSYITLMVRDIEKSIAFYQQVLGWQIVRRINPGMGEIAFMADSEGGTMLEFIQFAAGAKVAAQGLVMSYAVQGSLTEKHRQLCAMGLAPSAIVDNAPKPKYFTISDPDDLCVEITE